MKIGHNTGELGRNFRREETEYESIDFEKDEPLSDTYKTAVSLADVHSDSFGFERNPLASRRKVGCSRS
jgi:hypothetical protein